MKPQHQENAAAVGLGTWGAFSGLLRYYGPQTPSARAWTAIGIGVLAYELVCPEGQTLSEGVDRALESRKTLTSLAIGVTALHLINLLPPVIDPFSQAMRLVKEPR